MDNFNNNDIFKPLEVPNPAPASDLDEDEATDERPAIPGMPPIQEETSESAAPFKLADQPVGEMPQQSQFGQPMGGMPQQPQFGQPMNGMPQQPQFGQPMGGMPQQPQFGQPMGGMPQQPQFGQPMGGMNMQPYGQPSMGGGKPPKVKKPLSKGAIGGIIGGGVALIALIVCAIIFLPKLFPSDKEVVVNAFEATFGLESNSSTDDIIGLQEIADKFATTGGVREFSMELSANATGESMNVGAGFVETIDVQNKLANSDWTVSMNGEDFINVSMVVDETNTYFQVPELISGYFSLPNENIFQALENSELGQAMGLEGMGMPEFNMADMYFNLATSTSTTELNSEYVAIYEELWDSITYEKQGKAKIDVNGNTVTAKEYFITVPKDSMKKAISDMWDVAVAEAASNPAALAELGMDAATFQSTMSSYSSMITSLIKNDLVIKVYVKDKKIVKIICGDELSLYGVTLGYDFNLDIDDTNASGVLNFDVMGETAGIKFNAENIDTAPSGKITVFATGEVIDVNFKTTDNSSDSKEAYDIYCDVVYNGTTYVTADIKSNYDKGTNAFDGTMTFDIKDAGQIKAEYAGALKDVKKGEAYTIELSKCDILADGEKMMGMTAKIKIDTTTHDAKGIDTSLPVYDITTLTETDFESIVTENEALITEWLEANSDIFGSTVIEPTEPAEPAEPDEPEEDDMILEAGGKKVEILGCIDGFALDYVSDFYISYSTEAYSYVEYSLYEGWTVEEVVDFIYIPDENVYAQETGGHTMEVDGETICYSYAQYDSFGSTESSYMFAKEIGDGVVLCVSVCIYDDDESTTYTKEMLAEAISSKYCKVLN